MTPPNAAYGASLRHARAQRVRMIRRRVIAAALALFVATWLLITLMLVTGHDPALARQTAATKAVTATTTQTTATNAVTGTSGSPSATSTSSTPAAGASSTSSGSSNGTTAVTSSQS